MVAFVPSSPFAPNLSAPADETTPVRTVNYEIVHHIRGRIRFGIPRLSHDAKFAQRLGDSVTALPTVRHARVNRSASSLVVDYRVKPNGTHRNGNGSDTCASASVLPGLIDCIRMAAGAEVAYEIVPATQTKPASTTQAMSLPATQAMPATQTQSAPQTALPPLANRINYVKQLGLPVLALSLSAAATAGLALPGTLVGAVVLAATMPHAMRAMRGLREEKRLTVEVLDVTAAALLVAQSSFLASAFMISVIEGAEVARMWTARRGRQAGLDVIVSPDSQVLVERDGQQERVGAKDIVPGDIILLSPGDQIPVDGTVLDGSAAIDQHQVTGDAAPVTRQHGDVVYAATQVVEGHLRIQTTQIGADTYAATTLALMDAAPKPETRVSNYARKTGNWAVVPTLAVGSAVWATSGSMARASGIVSLDFGTGMRVAAPIAILRAQNYAAHHGILMRSGRAVEMLGQVDTILFDKTATLTDRMGTVVDIQALNAGFSAREVLALAASAEQALQHPLAEAIVRHAQDRGVALQQCTGQNFLAGEGVVAQIAGQVVHVGSARWLEEFDINIVARARKTRKAQDEKATRVFVAVNGQAAGVILCANPPRAESAEVIAKLRELNTDLQIFSGDSAAVVRATAADLGVEAEHVYAELLPEQKADLVKALQASGKKVAVVGDGINDAAAMAHADVAVSLGSASALARETADVVLLNDDLRDLLRAMEISRHALHLIKQNQAFVVGTNAAGIAYGALAVLNPIAGVLLNNGAALAAALNSLRTPGAPDRTAESPAAKSSPTKQRSHLQQEGI